MKECDACKANRECMAYVQPGSLICTLNKINYCGTHAEERQLRRQLENRQILYCQYCGKPLKIEGSLRYCNNVQCINRFEPV